MMKKIISFVLLLVSITYANAQVIAMADGTFNACGGGFLDSGGEGSSGYSANENITTTICPDAANSAVYVTFAVFNFGTGDQLTVYDGSSVADPIIGTYTGNDLQGQTVAASINNPTGCLTFVISTDAADNGWFASSVSCEPPCDNPEAIGSIGAASPLKICQGDQVTFDGSASLAGTGFNIAEYHWIDFNGDTTSQQTFTETFTTEGEYVYNLVVIDDNACKSVNFENFRVWVSTTPSFAGTTTNAFVCQGGDVCIDGAAEGVTYVGGVPTYGGGDTWLPDNVGECFTSTLDYTGAFPDGATLNDINDLIGICMFAEHSFIGDLVITITSPSGETVTLHEQGGGGTWLGEPIDTGSPDDSIGVCWEYCFSPTATLGTMADEANNVAGGSLPSGDYTSVYDLSGLLGSELNGLWQLDICDMWGADDGYLCDWNLTLNPELFIVEPSEYTPIINSDINSSYWTNFAVGDLSADGNQLCFNGVAPGTYPATYEVIDDFGCTYSIDAEVEIALPTTFTLGPDIVTCSTDIINVGITIDNFTGNEFDYSINWEPWDAVASSWDMNTTFDPAYGNVQIVVSAYEYNNENWQNTCPSTDTLNITVGAMMAVDSLATIPDGCETACTGEASVVLLDNNVTYTYQWDDGQTTQTATALCPGDHTVIVTDQDGCTDTQVITVEEETLEYSMSSDTLVCLNDTVTFQVVDDLGLGLTFNWLHDGQNFQGDTQDLIINQNSEIVILGTNPENCVKVDTINVTVNDPLVLTLTPNELICPGESVTLSPMLNGGMGSSTFLWSNNETSSNTTVSPDSTTNYILTVTDECDASVVDTAQVQVVEIPNWDITATTHSGCAPVAVQFSLTDSTNVSNVLWDVSNPMAMVTDYTGITEYIVSGQYTATVSLEYQGCADSIQHVDYIDVFANPSVTVLTDDPVHAIMFPEFCFQSAVTGDGIETYSWDFGGLASDDTEHPCYEFLAEESCHNVTLSITDSNSCTATDSLEVCLQPDLTIYIPNAFSPDGDSKNDVFYPIVSGYLNDSFQFLIYDRWGNLVFESDDPHKGWNGTMGGGSGVQMPIGVYVWKMNVTNLDKEEIQKTGEVTIIR